MSSFFDGLFAFVGAWIYIFFFSRCMYRREDRSAVAFWIAGILFSGVITVYSVVHTQTRFVTIILCILYCLYMFRTNFLTVLVWCLTALVVNGIADFIVTSASVQFPGVTFAATDVPGLARFVCVGAVKALQLLCYFLLTIRIRKSEKLGIGNGLLLLSIPVGAWVILEVLFTYVDALPLSFDHSTVPIIGGAGMLCILLAAIVLYNRMVLREREFASVQVQARMTQLTQANLDQINALYAKLRDLRHNYSSHFSVIAGLCEKGDLSDVRAYIHGLGDTDVRLSAYTGHPIMDSIISAKVSQMTDLRLDFSVDILTPEAMPISDVELSILLGNLLDNAIEAVAKSDAGTKRFIRLKAVVKERYWVVVCRNNAGRESFQTTDAVPSTKAKDGLHGIGTRQIVSIANATGGFVSFHQGDDMFTATVMLRLS